MVALGLVTAHGGDRKSERQIGNLRSYADQAASSLGVDKRTVQRDLTRGREIAPAVLAVFAGPDLKASSMDGRDFRLF